MTESEFKIFLNGAVILCAAMVLLNLALLKRKGTSAGLLAVAFLVCGLATYNVAQVGVSNLTYVGGGLVAALLLGDFVYRSAKRPAQKP